MTPLEATNALLAHVLASWNAADATITVDGEHFDPPSDAPWIRIAIRDLPTASVTHGAAGGRLAERRATLIAQVFAPLKPRDGQGPALALAIAFRDLLEPRDVVADAGTVHIVGGATVRRIGVDPAPPKAPTWYQVNVDVPLTYHETI